MRLAGVSETEGPHADSCAQPGEGQSGWSPHMLLHSHQQEGKHLNITASGVSVRGNQPVLKLPQILRLE